jgi:uncharacterized protein DUF1559
VELLMVIVIIGVLVALIMPALTAARGESDRITCQNHLKQLALGVQMYAADNEGKLPENAPGSPPERSWVGGNMLIPREATNQVLLRQGKLFQYASSARVYHCPGDHSQTNGAARVRSYSMNSWVGGRYMENYGQRVRYRTFVRESELTAAGPSGIWLVIDEHERSINDAWFFVTMDDNQPFSSFPATRHNRAYSLNFGDGHVELFKFHDPESISLDAGQGPERFSPKNADWLRLKQVTTLR